MGLCNVCGSALRMTARNLFVCKHGHATHVVQEVADYGEFIARRSVKRRKDKVKENILANLGFAEAWSLVYMEYFYHLVTLYSIPHAECKRYLPFLYYSLEKLKRQKEHKKYRYNTIFIILVYLIKRDLEEKKGTLYLISDFRRTMNFTLGAKTKFKTVLRALKRKIPSLISMNSVMFNFRLHRVKEIILRLVPRKNAARRKIMGQLELFSLDCVCEKLNLVRTSGMYRGFISFKETLKYVEIETYPGFLFAEDLIGAFLLMYLLTMCSTAKIDGKIKIVEKEKENTQQVVVQEFCSGETYFTSFDDINSLFCEIESIKEGGSFSIRPNNLKKSFFNFTQEDPTITEIAYLVCLKIADVTRSDHSAIIRISTYIAKTYRNLKKYI